MGSRASHLTYEATISTRLAPTREQAQPSKRDAIIEQAIIMFNEIGYGRVRISDITDSLNMSKSNFYRYFQTKKELLLACFAHVSEQFQILESDPLIPEGDFFTKIGPRVRNIRSRPWWSGLIELLRASEMSPDQEIKMNARRAYGGIADNIRVELEAAIRTGRATDLDAELAAYGFLGLAENLWFRAKLDDQYQEEQIAQFLDESVLRWLSSGAPGKTRLREHPDGAFHLVCLDGTEFHLENVRYNGQARITGVSGHAEIDVDSANVSSIVSKGVGEDWAARVSTIDGRELELRVDGSLVISGDAPGIGSVRVAMRDLSRVTRPPAT
jgi:AcrR family transcriptional regulator